jgi:hypothetical protein
MHHPHPFRIPFRNLIAKAILPFVIVIVYSVPAVSAINNPLLPDSILFITRDVCPATREGITGADHMCDQYFGFNACGIGGLYLLTGATTDSPMVTNLLASARVENGRLQGRLLTGGGFLSPELSYDAKTVLFAWVEQPASGEGWTSAKCFHIFKVNVDGTGLVQLTDGPYNDFDPCFLPNGRIAFVSERRGGYGRCHPRTVPTFSLYSMKDDGSDIVCLSYHETNEWNPSVNNDGMIVYTRWDYLDRDDCIAHHLWTCYPDGRDPRASHGNYPLPLTTFAQTDLQDGRFNRPNGEWNIRAVPGSVKYVAVAAGHHTQSFGDIILVDPSIPDDGGMAQIKGITSPRTTWCDFCMDRTFGTPWPLSEEWFLCNNGGEIALVDRDGVSRTVYASPAGRPLDPIPFRPRLKPPELPIATWQGERSGLAGHKRATIGILKADYGDMPLPNGTTITALRIMQVIPKATPLINDPRIGYGSEGLARVCLGTVPVESDGSAWFEAPVGKEIYFQLIDQTGTAVRSMRAGTYVHAGEQLTCTGCHEDKWQAVPANLNPLAFRRPPSPLAPEAGAEANGVTPINFYRLVKPVFDRKCTPCHDSEALGPSMSYASLEKYAFWQPGPGTPYLNGDIAVAVHGGSRTAPGKYGARMAPLAAKCDSSHHGVQLTGDEYRRIMLWLDGNSNEFSAYTHIAEQQQGKLVWPELDFDTLNPLGIETAFDPPQASLVRPCPHQGRRAPGISIYGRQIRIGAGESLAMALYNAAGKRCAARIVQSGSMIRLDDGLPPGVYIAAFRNVKDGSLIATEKIIR